jgi:hypothetical protein
MIRAAAAGLVLLALVVAGFCYVHSKSAVIDELIAASRRADVAAFSSRVDWEVLRANIKQDLAAQKKNMGEMGASMGPAAGQIDKVVDYFVQPENIDIAFYLHTEMFPQVKEEDFIDSTGYAFPFGFYVTLGLPKGGGNNDIPQMLRDRLKVRVVFRLDGLTWKMREMHVPLFMTPAHAYDVPAVKVYGRPQR